MGIDIYFCGSFRVVITLAHNGELSKKEFRALRKAVKKEKKKYRGLEEWRGTWTLKYDVEQGGAFAKMTETDDGETYVENDVWYVIPPLLIILKVAIKLGYEITPQSIPYNYDFGSGFMGVNQVGYDVLVRDVESPMREDNLNLYITSATLKDLQGFKSSKDFASMVNRRGQIIPGSLV